MKNDLEIILSGRRNDVADIVDTARILGVVFRDSRRILLPPHAESPILRLEQIALFVELVASGIDPCVDTIVQMTGLPRSTVRRRYLHRERAGHIKIERRGARKIICVERPRVDTVEILDAVTDIINNEKWKGR